MILGVASCTQFPDLDATVPAEAERSEYLELVPFETLKAEQPSEVSAEASLAARSAALRARAARLRGTVVDQSTRARMTNGVRDQ